VPGTAKVVAGYRETAMAEDAAPADGKRIGKAKRSLPASAVPGRPALTSQAKPPRSFRRTP